MNSRTPVAYVAVACVVLLCLLAVPLPTLPAAASRGEAVQNQASSTLRQVPKRSSSHGAYFSTTDGLEQGMGLLPGEGEAPPVPAPPMDSGGGVAASVNLLGSFPPVRSQGAQNSCVGWAVGYYAMSYLQKQEYPAWDLRDGRRQTSPSFIYNQINGGSDGGSTIESALRLLEGSGACDIAEFPYDPADYSSQPGPVAMEAACQYRISPEWGCFFNRYSPSPKDLSLLKQYLAAGHPVVVGIPVYSDFPGTFGNPSAGFYSSKASYSEDEFEGGHALCLAGYDDAAGGGQGGFLAVNSWGGGWNDGGTIWLSYGFLQNHAYEAWTLFDMNSDPVQYTVSPTFGAPGDRITLTGSNFGAQRRSAKVTFPGVSAAAKVTSWRNNEIQLLVPQGAGNGMVVVTDWDSMEAEGRRFNTDGTPLPSWYFPEGATWPGFDEWILIQNPNDSDSMVKLQFATGAGVERAATYRVSAKSRLTVHVNEYVPNADVSVIVTVLSGPGVAAERSMYFGHPSDKWGSHDSVGVRDPAERWYLAEGTTIDGYDEWLQVLNPSDAQVMARVTFHTPGGPVDGPLLSMPPMTRKTVHVNDHIGRGDLSIEVRSLTEGKGIVAERSMYINSPDGKRGATNSIGTSEAGGYWVFAEGTTANGYEEWILIQNPSGVDVPVNLLFYMNGEVRRGPSIPVGAGRRVSVKVNDYVAGKDVSTVVSTATPSGKVVAERVQYVNAPDGKTGAHDALGSQYLSRGWYLTEGCTSPGFEEWLLLVNPSMNRSSSVRILFMAEGGGVRSTTITVPASSRGTVRVNDYYVGNVSVKVESSGYVAAERAMYMRTGDGKTGATCSAGIPSVFVASSY